MFPLVPYHALPRLHELVKADMPTPYGSIRAAWQRVAARRAPAAQGPRLPRQTAVASAAREGRKAHPHHASQPRRRRLDRSLRRSAVSVARMSCDLTTAGKPIALYRDAAGALFATDGICTHGNTHLADGLVMGGADRMSQAQRTLPPGRWLTRPRAGLPRAVHLSRRKPRRQAFPQPAPRRRRGARMPKTLRLRVVSNRNVATFIKETCLRAGRRAEPIDFTPGDYLQFDIPAYDCIRFRDFDIPQPYAAVWEAQHVFDLVAQQSGRRPPQQLLAGLQSANRIHAPLQRPHRHAAARTGLPAGRRLRLHVQPQARRHRHAPSDRSATFTSSPRRRKWCTSAAVRAWRRCGPICRICLKAKKRPAE